MNKAVFLDRDGTLIEHIHYLTDPNRVKIVDGGAEALKRLQEAGYLLVVVSNQSLVGRGYGTEDDVNAVNARMAELLQSAGVTLDSVKYCPHHPDEDCPNRKPKPGMLLEAAEELNIDLTQSVMIGDNPTDTGAGENARCRLNILLVEPGSSAQGPSAGSLSEAADRVLQSAQHSLH